MRIAHATDIHWFAPPRLRDLPSKRLLGTANLYLKGRRRHFDPGVQDALVASMTAQAPDAVIITGDLTAQALDTEFALARTKLGPLLASVPSLVIEGNHDVYTRGAAAADRLETHFAPFTHLQDDGLAVLSVPGLYAIGLDPNRPHLTASGVVPAAQLEALPGALASAPEQDAVVLALHYPVLDRRGAPYVGWEHGLRNAHDLIEVLRQAPRRPDLIIHGHDHHGFQVDLDLGDCTVPILNPGSSGYAFLPDHDRAACFNVYTFDGPTLVDVERFRFDGTTFAPEAGGAYATGR